MGGVPRPPAGAEAAAVPADDADVTRKQQRRIRGHCQGAASMAAHGLNPEKLLKSVFLGYS